MAEPRIEDGERINTGRSHRAELRSPLWSSVDRLVATAAGAGGSGVDGLVAHKLGPLAAGWFDRAGLAVPERLREEQRAAALSTMLALPLVRRIRATAEGPLMLIKGPEVAALYPTSGRRFSDVDVLSPSAEAVQGSLLTSGFIEVDHEYYNLVNDHHHLHPIRYPAVWLNVEVHSEPNWPVRTRKPAPVAEVLEAAVPSALGIEGVLAPARMHHALLLAAHAWRDEPLHRLRDLVDIAVLAENLNYEEYVRTADRWGIGRLWRTTWGAIEALFYGGAETLPLRLWAAHLKVVRERTVLENHLQHWLSPYWELSVGRAVVQTGRTLRADLTTADDETWAMKLKRTAGALRHPLTPATQRRRDSA